MHSTWSDGTCSVRELVEQAKERGLRGIALTDHDTVDGMGELQSEAKAANLDCITGVELNSDYEPGVMHFLGYGINPDDEDFRRHLTWIQGGRKARNEEMIRRLNDLGIDISLAEVEACAVRGNAGRPHFAQVMISKGYVKSKRHAFTRYLGNDRPGYAPRRSLSPKECIALIRDAGGVSVLAHPQTLGMGKKLFRETIAELSSFGLGGLEVFYAEFNRRQEQFFAEVATENNLIMTGGSDYHGAASPNISIGIGSGTLHVPDESFVALRERIAGCHAS
jgi:predicted metal-dependent phosphoesterase TrpH